MVQFYEHWVKQFPILSIEDGMAEGIGTGGSIDGRSGKEGPAGGRRSVCHQHVISAKGISMGVANSILIKVNQIAR